MTPVPVPVAGGFNAAAVVEHDYLAALGLASGDEVVADLQSCDDRLKDYLDIRRHPVLDEGQLAMLSQAHRRVRQVLDEITRTYPPIDPTFVDEENPAQC